MRNLTSVKIEEPATCLAVNEDMVYNPLHAGRRVRGEPCISLSASVSVSSASVSATFDTLTDL